MVNSLSKSEKHFIVANVAKTALYNAIIIRILSCIICCSIFTYFAPNPQENQLVFFLHIVLMVILQLSEYINQKDVLYPSWFDKYQLGYIPYPIGILFGYFIGRLIRNDIKP